MTDELDEILAAEGLTPEVIARIHLALRAKGLRVGLSDRAIADNYQAQAKAQRDAYAAAAQAAAVPYAGAIKECQASVHDQGRGVGFHRCRIAGKWARRITNDPHGDGRLVVCTTHLRDPLVARYLKRWSYEVSADEPVEPEYQPTQVERA